MFKLREALALTVLALFSTLSVAANSEGCGKPAAITSGTKSMTVNGKSRQYIIRVPNNYDSSKSYRLVFGFHWAGGTMNDVASGQTVQRDTWSYFGLQRLANETAIFVAPQGLSNGWANNGGEDFMFVDALIKSISSGLCVDSTQLYATGFSYGGQMTYALACTRASVFRAVTVLSGGGPVGNFTCSKEPIAYMEIMGIRDRIEGGRASRDVFVKNNGCTPQTPKEPTQGSLTHIKTTYSGCSAGHPVVWIAFDAGHIAAPRDGATSDSGTQTFSPGETWGFWGQFF